MNDESEQAIAAIFSLGENFLSQGKYDKAQIIFDGLMALEPDQLAPALAFGEALLKCGEPERALDHLLTLVQKFSHDARLLVLTAKACILLGKNEEAKEFLQPLLETNVAKEHAEARAMMRLLET